MLGRKTFSFFANRTPWSRCVELAMVGKEDGGRVSVAKPVVFEVKEPDFIITEPMVRLEIEEAQELMDELWRCGLRPTEGTGSAGSLAATEKHLADMQRIAMGLLKQHGV